MSKLKIISSLLVAIATYLVIINVDLNPSSSKQETIEVYSPVQLNNGDEKALELTSKDVSASTAVPLNKDSSEFDKPQKEAAVSDIENNELSTTSFEDELDTVLASIKKRADLSEEQKLTASSLINNLMNDLKYTQIDYQELLRIRRMAGALKLTGEIIALIERGEFEGSSFGFQADNLVADLYQTKAWQTLDQWEARPLHVKANQIRDSILAQDPENWAAINSQAFSDYVSPSYLNKMPDSIKKYQRLIEVQRILPQQDYFAFTYVNLYNAYMKVGEPAKAKAAIQQGLNDYPYHEGIISVIEMSQ